MRPARPLGTMAATQATKVLNFAVLNGFQANMARTRPPLVGVCADLLAGDGGEDRVHRGRRGVGRAELPKPRSSSQRLKLKRLAHDIFGGDTAKPALSVPTHEIDELLLLSSWFRRFPAEMTHTRQVS